MISNPDLVRYTCIAHHYQHTIDSPNSTILAEFNSADSSLQDLAQRCIHLTPPHHRMFSQTFRNQTYTFLFDDPFVYFGIFDPKMIKDDQIKLFDRLKEAFSHIIVGAPDRKLTSYCLQGELHPVLQKLMSKSLDFDARQLVPPNGLHIDHSTNDVPASKSSKGRKILSLPMLNSCKIAKGVKKKRMSGDSVTDSKEALVVGKLDVLDDDVDVDVGEVRSREIICQNGVCLMDGHGNMGRQKAKKIWRRHVWIVLVLDLAVCLILFGIWLFVCRGFQCIDG